MNTAIPTTDMWRKHLLERDAWFAKAAGSPRPTPTAKVLAAADDAVAKWQAAGHDIAYETGSSTSWHQGISPKLLPTLASAFEARPSDVYAQMAKAIFQRVMMAEPWHEGWLPERKLQPLIIAHRLGDTETAGWFGSLPPFLKSDIFDDDFLATLITSAQAQLNYLKSHMHPGRNIRLTQADALMTQGLNLSLLPEANSWLAQGVHVLNDGFARLIAPDGASREATAWYHTILMHMGMRLWRIQQAAPELGLVMHANQIAAMFDYTLACIEPDGRATRIGDTVGNIAPDQSSGQGLGTFIKLRQQCLAELGCEVSLPAPAQYFNVVNQAMLRTDWTTAADYLTFDATTRYGHHWHPGRNSLQLCIGGTRVLADPGRMSYDDTPYRKYALSTRAHSTLNLNGHQQADTPASLTHQQTANTQFLDGQYAGGYWPIQNSEHGKGVFAKHQRSVLWLQNRFILVIDHLTHTQGQHTKPSVELLWHYAPGQVTLDKDRRCASSTHTSTGQEEQPVRLDLHTLLCPTDAVMSSHQGQLTPDVLGWYANDVTDQPEPSPSVMLRIAHQDLWRLDLATLLVPDSVDAKGNRQAPKQIAHHHAHDASEKPYAHLCVVWEDGSSDLFWWTRDLIAALDEVETTPASLDSKSASPIHFITDASLLHMACDTAGTPTRITLVDGSFARTIASSSSSTASASTTSWKTPVASERGMIEVDLQN